MEIHNCITTQNKVSENDHALRLTVKWSPLHLMAPYPTLQIALEHPVARKFSIQYEVGPVMMINQINQFSSSSESRFRGFKAKLDVRRHFWRSNRHFFWAQEVFYNRVNSSREDLFLVHSETNNTADYTIPIRYDKRYREYGTVLKVGLVKSVGRFYFDIYCGISVSYIDDYSIKRPAYPTYTAQPSYDRMEDLQYLLDLSRPFDNPNIGLRPTFGLRLGYISVR